MMFKCLQWFVIPLLIYLGARWARPSDSTRAPDPTTSEQTPASPISNESLTKWRRAQAEPDPIERLHKSWEAAEEMTNAQLASAFVEATADANQEAILSLGERFAQRDPKALIALDPEALLINAAYQQWSKVDPVAAFEHYQDAKRSPSGSLGKALAIAVLSKNPSTLEHVASALANTSFLPASAPEFTGDVSELARNFHEASPEVASESLAKLLGRAILTSAPTTETNARFWTWWQALPSALQAAALPTINRQTPDAIVAPMETQSRLAELAQEDQAHVPAFMRFYGNAWATEAPSDAFAWVLDRYHDVALPGMRWDRVSGGMTMMWDNDRPTRAFEEALKVPVRAMTLNDPMTAIDALTDIPHLRARSAMAVEIAATWAETEPEAALAWSGTLPSEELRQSAQHRGLTAWAQRDLDAATAYGLSQNDGLAPLEAIASHLSTQDSAQAAAWLASLPAEKMEPLLGQFISRPPRQDRVLRFQQALQGLPISAGQQKLHSLIGEWTRSE